MKVWTILAAALVVFSAGAVLLSGDGSVADSDEEQTANYSIKGDETSAKPGAELKFDITFTETAGYSTLSVSYTAKLTDSSGSTESDAVTPSSGDVDDGAIVTLTVTAPDDTGRYTLTVTWEETVDDGDEKKFTDSVDIRVVTPITLSATISNNGEVDIDTNVYFYVDGVKAEDSSTALKVSPGESTTITYEYYNSDLSQGKHSFHVATSDGSIVLSDSSFYYEDGNYDWLNYIMAIIFVIVIIALIYVVRKPVKNYGKPKARR